MYYYSTIMKPGWRTERKRVKEEGTPEVVKEGRRGGKGEKIEKQQPTMRRKKEGKEGTEKDED